METSLVLRFAVLHIGPWEETTKGAGIAVGASWWKDNNSVTSDEPSDYRLKAKEPNLSKQMQSEIA